MVVALLVIGIEWAHWTSPQRNVASSTKTSGSSAGAWDVYADTPFENAHPGSRMSGTRLVHAATERSPSPTDHILWAITRPGRGHRRRSADHRCYRTPVQYRGLHYTVERREGRVFQSATRRDAAGSVLAKTEAEVRFALGSGTRGTVFLIDREGFLFQSPIAWFAQKGRWDIAPGYGEVNPYPSFERPIEPECLFCHTNQVRRGRDIEPLRAAGLRGPRHRVRGCHGPRAARERVGCRPSST